jgi:hypothetical protein
VAAWPGDIYIKFIRTTRCVIRNAPGGGTRGVDAEPAALCDARRRLLARIARPRNDRRTGEKRVALCEDVGRDELDKLAGMLARQGIAADDGLLLSGRVSVEPIQNAAMLRAQVIVAVSVPIAPALRLAEDAGTVLIGIARDDGCEIFTHSERIAHSELIALRAVQHVGG